MNDSKQTVKSPLREGMLTKNGRRALKAFVRERAYPISARAANGVCCRQTEKRNERLVSNPSISRMGLSISVVALIFVIISSEKRTGKPVPILREKIQVFKLIVLSRRQSPQLRENTP